MGPHKGPGLRLGLKLGAGKTGWLLKCVDRDNIFSTLLLWPEALAGLASRHPQCPPELEVSEVPFARIELFCMVITGDLLLSALESLTTSVAAPSMRASSLSSFMNAL